MASKKQLEANRINAKRSTGPKSGVGKARSRVNAFTHGLTAELIVVSGEEAESFNTFREALFVDLNPMGALQCELVDQLAGLLWRLRRIPRLEAELLKVLGRSAFDGVDWGRLVDKDLEIMDELLTKARGEEPSLPLHEEEPKKERGLPRRVEMLTVLSRYEASLMRAVGRNLSMLHALKASRAKPDDDSGAV